MPFDNQINAVAQAHPLHSRALYREVHHGATVAEIVAGFDLDARFGLPQVHLVRAGEFTPVPMDMWSRVRPKPGTRVEISYAVEGPLLALAPLMISQAAPYIAGTMMGLAGTAYTVAVAAITVVGGLMVNALIPPVKQPKRDMEQYVITGVQNAENRYGIYPKVLGRHRMFPPKTARGYTETVGRDIYYRGRMSFGWGPLALEDLRIGTTPIHQFDGVEVEFLNVDQAQTLANYPELAAITKAWRSGTAKLTLCPDDVAEDAYAVQLTHNNAVTRFTRDRTESASIDIGFPRGLLHVTRKGKHYNSDASFRFRYRAVGGGAWTNAGTERYESNTTSYIRFTKVIEFPAPGEYEIEVMRTSADTDGRTTTDSHLHAIRSFRTGDLPSHDGIAEVAFRIKASDQLSGQVDSLNAIVQQMASIWTGSEWTVPTPVRHPAWIYLNAIRGPHLRRPVEDFRIDLAAFKAWADEEPHWTCDYVIDADTRTADVLDIIAAAGRGRRALTDLQYSIIRDGANGPIRQVFSPRNSWGFKASLAFPRQIHALRCMVRSERLDWEQDEVTVYADGYDHANATEFETLEIPGVVITREDEDESNAWRLGRYHLAQAIHRPETYEWHADWEHMRVTRGDKVQFVHDVPLIGVGAARITAIAGNQITLDEQFDFDAAPFRLTVRAANGDRHVLQATSPADPSSRTWTRTAGAMGGAAVGDLVLIEEVTQEAMEVLVTGIYPEGDSARITAVPAAPVVLQADQGSIPPYAPIITPPRLPTYGPPVPSVLAVGNASIQERDGSLTPRISVAVRPMVHMDDALRAQLRWRMDEDQPVDPDDDLPPPTSGDWEQDWQIGRARPSGETLFTARLIDGAFYEVEVRHLAANDRASAWVSVGRLQAQAREFDYEAPTGWQGWPAMDHVILAGDPYDVADFHEFRVYGATADSDDLTLVGRPVDPEFRYSGDFVRFQVRAADHSGVESPPTDWISVVPRGVSVDDLAQDFRDAQQAVLDQLDRLESWIGGEGEGAWIVEGLDQLAADLRAEANKIVELADDLSTEAGERLQDSLTAGENWRALVREVEAVRDYAAQIDYSAFESREELRRQLSAVTEGYAASFDERINVATSETAAISERITVFEAEGDQTRADLIRVETAMVDGFDAVSRELTVLSAGSNVQFDSAIIWHFDEGAEGWSGQWTSGWLRPGDQATSPLVEIYGSRYRQVRARLRRVGSPTWAGTIQYRQAGAWSASVPVPEPVWLDGIADLTVNMDWLGEIEAIRLTLTSGSDSANQIEMDWLAIGRPAPGASTAELIEEREARISEDEAQALLIDGLSSRLSDAETGLSGTADAVDGLTTRVTTAEGTLTSQGEDITALHNTITDPVAGLAATADAVDQLTQEVSAAGIDGISVQGRSIRSLHNELLPLSLETLDEAFAAFLDNRGISRTVTSATQYLETQIDLTDGRLEVLSQSVTALEATVPGLASADALQALTTRVTLTEVEISSVAQDLTNLSAAVDSKASSSALDALTARVTDAEGTLDSQGQSITNLTNTINNPSSGLPSKASTSALNALTTRVTNTETVANSKNRVWRQNNAPANPTSGDIWFKSNDKNKASRWNGTAWQSVEDGDIPILRTDINAQASALTDLSSVVDGKASSTALNALTTRVTVAEGNINSHTDALTAVNAGVGRLSAGGRLRVTTQATPTGADARIGFHAEASDGESTHSAAMYLIAESNGTSSVLINANRFALVTGTGADTDRHVPFLLDGTDLYLADALVHASNMRVDGRLDIHGGGSLTAYKARAGDPADGLFFGQIGQSGGFGLVASRTNSNGTRQSVDLRAGHFTITNARHKVSAGLSPGATVVDSSQVINLPNTSTTVSLTIVGGGGGGNNSSGESNNGSQTVVRLRDGTNVVQTWTASGGAGSSGSGIRGRGSGQNSALGEGGSGGRWDDRQQQWISHPTAGTRGGGGGGVTAGGRAGQDITVDERDVSGLSNPNLQITIGSGGASAGANSASGGNGAVEYSYTTAEDIDADVLPVKPTAWGAIVKTNDDITFPNLGAGLWCISRQGDDNLGIGRIRVAPGAGRWVEAERGGSITFVASQTPVRMSGGWGGTRTLYYTFWKLGGWA